MGSIEINFSARTFGESESYGDVTYGEFQNGYAELIITKQLTYLTG